MADTYLKSWLDRVENLENEQKGIGTDKRDLYTEAKSKGYNPKALRRIVAARKRKDEDEIEADVEVYKVALGLAVDLVRNDKLSLREASRKTGASKSSIHRALAVPAVSQTTTTPERAADTAVAENAAPALPRDPQTEATREVAPVTPAPNAGTGTGTNSRANLEVHHALGQLELEGKGANPLSASVSPPADNSDNVVATKPKPLLLYQRITGAFVDPREDDLAFPTFLDRRKQVQT